ncbi:MAG: hypothetical protein IH897_03410, partial [Planctomycetes bacterium]|nr:hypothetical protein [Planctomycetota bacterium]
MIRVPLTPIVISMVVFSVPVASVRAADPDVEKIAQQLRDVADRLDELADFNKLGTNIPFTSFNPSDALELANLFKQSLRTAMDNALAGTGTDSCANLAAELDGADTTVGGVTISFDNVTHSCASSPFSFGFDVHAQATVTPSLSVNDQTSGIGLSGGELSVTVTLDTTLNFQLDTSVGDPAQGFALLVPQGNAPKIEVCVNATGSITGFAGLAGIADVDVTGTAELDIDVRIEFIDPDDNGLLTIDELTSTSFADLVTVSYLEESGKEVNITLELNSTLIPGSPDASITLMHDDLSGFSGDLDAPGDVSFNLGNDLENFLNTSPTEILSGLSSVAASIDAFQLISDVQVPFLDVSLRKAFRFVEPIQDFLRAQSDLAIACGTIDDNSPRGDISNLKNGEHFFCQATGLSNPVEFTWQLGTNVVFISDLAGQTDPATIGTTPTKTVEFAMSFTPSPPNETQRPDIEVDFRLEGDLASRTASRLFLSAEELLPKLLDLGGFTSDMTAPVYDSNTKTLTYHLKKEFNPDPLGEAIKLDFSDQLKEGTGLCGLGATAQAAAEIDAGPIKVEFTFGIILVEDVADITPNDPDPVNSLDRFFIQVRSDGGFELEADVTVTVNPLELKGRVGFLSVDVVGDAGANPVNSSAVFEVVRNPSNAAQPMLAIDIKPDPNGIEITGASTIMDAVLVTDLFKDLSGSIAPQFNISMSGGLMASADLATASGMLEAQIGIDLPNVVVGTWPDISLGTPTFTGNFDTNLQIFDTDPSIFGNATATSSDQGVCSQDDSINCHHASAEADCGAGNTCDTPTDTLTDTVTSEDFREGTCSEDSSVDCLTDADCTVSASDECQAAILGRTLRNLTDGSECVITGVVDADNIECSLGG